MKQDNGALVFYFNNTNVAVNPGGFVAYNPATVVAHTEFTVELFLKDTMSAEKVRNRGSDPYGWTIVRTRVAGRRADTVTSHSSLCLWTSRSQVTLPPLWGSLCQDIYNGCLAVRNGPQRRKRNGYVYSPPPDVSVSPSVASASLTDRTCALYFSNSSLTLTIC
jgi:hypothetical protein